MTAADVSQEWRKDPHLRPFLHPDYPDDAQVLVHDGGPRLTDRRPELVWVRVLAMQDGTYRGTVLNEPQQLLTVKRGDRVQFVAPGVGGPPVMVTGKYLRERTEWTVGPCDQCGFSELLDAPSDLLPVIFPNLGEGEVVAGFTSFCGACGGVQVVRRAEDADDDPEPPPRRWWQFWR